MIPLWRIRILRIYQLTSPSFPVCRIPEFERRDIEDMRDETNHIWKEIKLFSFFLVIERITLRCPEILRNCFPRISVQIFIRLKWNF